MPLVEILFLFAFIPIVSGTAALFFTYRTRKPYKPSVVLFHSISTCQQAHFSHFPPDRFIRLIGEFARLSFYSRTLSEAAGGTQGSDDFAITFDDGFESFYSRAFPALEDNNMKVTVFPIAGYVGKLSLWDILPPQPHMNKAQIREISDHGHEIGSHTFTHANLTFLSDADIERELADSKRLLEDITGKQVTSLSFPYGSWNKRVWEKARAIGYQQGTCYRHHNKIIDGLVPVHGVYSFDSIQDVIDKISSTVALSNAYARSRIMSHFAKGTPLWKFQSNYALFRR
jgi:peptidoglycan/xylan/chitin deacetylase (PgdA/CDA1 family)